MMKPVLAAAAVAIVLLPTAARAGAWTLAAGHWQSFSATTQSQAGLSFAADGRASVPTKFSKTLLQNAFEFGVTDYLTVFATPAYVVASLTTPTTPLIHAHNTSIEAGARLMLDARIGKLSLQGSYKSAGSFDLSVSAAHESGRQIELRLLYGTGFQLYDHDGFFDAQIAQRWIAYPRPNETPVDLTLGFWLTRNTMLMAQSFNIVSAGDARAPYGYYRTHKLEFSLVERLSRHWSLQTGAFYSPAGQNALVEKGISVVLWTQD